VPLFSSALSYVEGVQPLLPRHEPTTDAFLDLQGSFGVSHIFPTQIVIVPDNSNEMLTRAWFDAACTFVKRVAANVTAEMDRQGRDCLSPPGQPCMVPADFEGLMIIGGNCTAELYDAIPSELVLNASDGRVVWTHNVSDAKLEQLVAFMLETIGNADHLATKVRLTTAIDPFGEDGRAWLQAVRDALGANEYVDGVHIGQLFFTGLPLEQMDGAHDTFEALPLVVGATLCIVCVVLLVAFQSILVPIRAVLCLVWMLIVTFGSALLVYQQGALEGLHVGFVSPTGGALFWMSPCISFSIVVGLGLDYDIFLMESAVEFWDHGASAREAVVMALDATGNIICLAGVIMTLAFGALLIGSSSCLNQIGYLLIVGVLIDCFITTKVIIPCAMTLLPYDLNFWPRKRPPGIARSNTALAGNVRHIAENDTTWEVAD